MKNLQKFFLSLECKLTEAKNQGKIVIKENPFFLLIPLALIFLGVMYFNVVSDNQELIILSLDTQGIELSRLLLLVTVFGALEAYLLQMVYRESNQNQITSYWNPFWRSGFQWIPLLTFLNLINFFFAIPFAIISLIGERNIDLLSYSVLIPLGVLVCAFGVFQLTRVIRQIGGNSIVSFPLPTALKVLFRSDEIRFSLLLSVSLLIGGGYFYVKVNQSPQVYQLLQVLPYGVVFIIFSFYQSYSSFAPWLFQQKFGHLKFKGLEFIGIIGVLIVTSVFHGATHYIIGINLTPFSFFTLYTTGILGYLCSYLYKIKEGDLGSLIIAIISVAAIQYGFTIFSTPSWAMLIGSIFATSILFSRYQEV
jgi:hypothetical protein